jgi:hypothetical protein
MFSRLTLGPSLFIAIMAAAESFGSNKNSYLVVQLPDTARDGLSELSRFLEEVGCETAPVKDEGSRDSTSVFDPMAHESLHITFYFAGEGLHTLPAHSLCELHAAAAADTAMTPSSSKPTVVLRFTGLALFPPGKQNLVVALFDAPPMLHALQAKVWWGYIPETAFLLCHSCFT